MLRIFKKKKSQNGSGKLVELPKVTTGSWVDVVAPTAQEIAFLEKEFQIPLDVIQSILAPDTMPRIERDKDVGYYLILLRAPLHVDDGPTMTVPLGVIFCSTKKRKIILTISASPLRSISKIIDVPPKQFCTDNKALFTYELLRKIIRSYMRELSIIENKIDAAQESIQHSVQNKEVLLLQDFFLLFLPVILSGTLFSRH